MNIVRIRRVGDYYQAESHERVVCGGQENVGGVDGTNASAVIQAVFDPPINADVIHMPLLQVT